MDEKEDLIQTAIRVDKTLEVTKQRVTMLENSFLNHQTRLNGSLDKFVAALERFKESNSDGHANLYKKIDEEISKWAQEAITRVSIKQAWLYGVLGSIISGVIVGLVLTIARGRG